MLSSHSNSFSCRSIPSITVYQSISHEAKREKKSGYQFQKCHYHSGWVGVSHPSPTNKAIQFPPFLQSHTTITSSPRRGEEGISTTNVSNPLNRLRYLSSFLYLFKIQYLLQPPAQKVSDLSRIRPGAFHAGSKASSRRFPQFKRSKPMMVIECFGRWRKIGGRVVCFTFPLSEDDWEKYSST